MGNRTYTAAAIFLFIGLLPLPARADIPGDPVTFFAHCAGRLSAELSHQWMRSDPSSDDTEALHRATLSILQAITPTDHARGVLSMRVDARNAHAGLLTRGYARGDAWARERAAARLAECAALVLGPSEPVPAEANQDRETRTLRPASHAFD
ncbi:MAG: hypothetical protein AAFQ06_10330 [Pseudomonadota bacterium]